MRTAEKTLASLCQINEAETLAEFLGPRPAPALLLGPLCCVLRVAAGGGIS